MAKSATAAVPATLVKKTKFQKFLLNARQNWQLHLMLFLPVVYIIIFNYAPLYGLQLAFKDYSPRKGIWGSEWIGFENMARFFEYYRWGDLVWNTVALNIYDLFLYFPMPIILALAMHVYTGKFLKKLTQNVSYIPHFISLVVMVGIINTVLNPVTGFVGHIYKLFGIKGAVDIRGDKDAFRMLYTLTDLWQGIGWSSIIYISALSAVPEELHEAAKIDGASRLRRVWSIDIPTLLPMIALQLILRMGGMLSMGYQKAYLMQNEMNMDTSEIISTYVYKQGIVSGNMSFGTAVGLMQTAINTVLVFVVNWITNLLTDNELGLF